MGHVHAWGQVQARAMPSTQRWQQAGSLNATHCARSTPPVPGTHEDPALGPGMPPACPPPSTDSGLSVGWPWYATAYAPPASDTVLPALPTPRYAPPGPS